MSSPFSRCPPGISSVVRFLCLQNTYFPLCTVKITANFRSSSESSKNLNIDGSNISRANLSNLSIINTYLFFSDCAINGMNANIT